VQPDHVRKSVGAENTFEEDMSLVGDMEAELQRIALTVSDRMRRIETKGRTITLKVRYHDFELVAMYPLPQVSQSQSVYKQAYLKYQTEKHGRMH
jgi:nucleotidyltransferase/DNA polymerase involved in DNA repair